MLYNPGQVVSTDVPLSPSSVYNWYQPVGDGCYSTAGQVTDHGPPWWELMSASWRVYGFCHLRGGLTVQGWDQLQNQRWYKYWTHFTALTALTGSRMAPLWSAAVECRMVWHILTLVDLEYECCRWCSWICCSFCYRYRFQNQNSGIGWKEN